MGDCVICLVEKEVFVFSKSCKCKYNVCEECHTELIKKNGSYKCLYNCTTHATQTNNELYYLNNTIYDPFEIYLIKNINFVCSIVDPYFAKMLREPTGSIIFMLLYIIPSFIFTFCVLVPTFILSAITGSIMYCNKSNIARTILRNSLFPIIKAFQNQIFVIIVLILS